MPQSLEETTKDAGKLFREQYSENIFQQDDDVFIPQFAVNTPAPQILQDSTEVVNVPASQCIVDVPVPQDLEDVAVCAIQKCSKIEEYDKQTPTYGDIVFFDKRPQPYRVYLVGYGEYKGRIRVARLFENHHIRENGNWQSCTGCCRLEVGDAVLCASNVTAIAPDSFLSHRGSYCVFHGWDSDWDLDPVCCVRWR